MSLRLPHSNSRTLHKLVGLADGVPKAILARLGSILELRMKNISVEPNRIIPGMYSPDVQKQKLELSSGV